MRFNPKQNIVFIDNRSKSLEKLIVLMRGMIDEDSIPIVNLDHNPRFNSYFISYPKGIFEDIRIDGGHSRLLSAYLLDCELDVNINISSRVRQMEIPLKETSLFRDPSILGNDRFNQQKYSQLPTPQEFFDKYSRINEALRGAVKDYSFTPETYRELFEAYQREYTSTVDSIRAWFG